MLPREEIMSESYRNRTKNLVQNYKIFLCIWKSVKKLVGRGRFYVVILFNTGNICNIIFSGQYHSLVQLLLLWKWSLCKFRNCVDNNMHYRCLTAYLVIFVISVHIFYSMFFFIFHVSVKWSIASLYEVRNVIY